MKLYNKQLKSLEDLKREKHVLMYARKQSQKDTLESFNNVRGKFRSKKSGSNKSDIIGIATDLLTSKSSIDMLMSFGMPALKFAGKKAEKNILKTVFGEILGGYLKWKLIYFGIKTVRKFIQSKKNSSKGKA